MKEGMMERSTREDMMFIDDGIVAYNQGKVPFTQKPAFIPVNRVIRNEEGEILAGVNSMIYCWRVLAIDVLWVKEEYRKRGYGTRLLEELERVAKEENCSLMHLDTFDFQAKEFYEKNGFAVFGTLENCPPGHMRYYMKKEIGTV
ncbi:GNAT family N-acetyltransferase [Proteiniclasticum sp. SCR006]|uniref:GNAT family N-acetyltransferase n=1 Tax=Proteiniclasticum aestuarii TaxID=2817862 RepID=A0A939KJ30_9CLOT|nr:GNAT family N-acetyltransferase [Proteiniclasticum aestuarii]MBO1264616.1 GNAT family N-acetyltransferase [Proteiniclasticum aestuarii]